MDDDFTDELLDELRAMKEGKFNEFNMDKILYQMPDRFVFKRYDFSIVTETFKTVNVRSATNHKKVYEFYKQCFDHIDDPDGAVVDYFNSCKGFDFGPFGTKLFQTGTLRNQTGRLIGYQHLLSGDEWKKASKNLAWLLICDPEDTLKYFFNHAIQNDIDTLPFINRLFAQLPLVCRYDAAFPFFKGNIFLKTLQIIIEDPSNQRNPTSLLAIQNIIINLAFSRGKKATLFSPNQLLDVIILQLSRNKMSKFWLEIFYGALKKLSSKDYEIKWDFNSSKLSMNPVNLCVWLLKFFAKEESNDLDLEQIFQALGNHFKAHRIEFKNTEALKLCNEVDWTTKFFLLDRLSIPSTSYQREIPKALHFVLSKYDQRKYCAIDDSSPTFENYLIALFELFIIGENVPDEFMDNVSLVHPTMNDECGEAIARALFRAFTNVSDVLNAEFKENTLQFLDKLIDKLGCPFELKHVQYVNREIFEAIKPLQSILLLGKAIRASNPSKSAVDNTKIENKPLQKLLLSFCYFVNKVLQCYHAKLHPVTSYSRSNDSQPDRLPHSTYITTTTVFGVLKSAVDPMYLLFSPGGPDELTLLKNTLNIYMDEIFSKLVRYYPFDASQLPMFTQENHNVHHPGGPKQEVRIDSEQESEAEHEKEDEMNPEERSEAEHEKEDEMNSEQGSEVDPEKEDEMNSEQGSEADPEKEDEMNSEQGSEADPEKEDDTHPQHGTNGGKESVSDPWREYVNIPWKEDESDPWKEDEMIPEQKSGHELEAQLYQTFKGRVNATADPEIYPPIPSKYTYINLVTKNNYR